jgi:hypothetical protein
LFSEEGMALFALPALSSKERENCCQSVGESGMV